MSSGSEIFHFYNFFFFFFFFTNLARLQRLEQEQLTPRTTLALKSCCPVSPLVWPVQGQICTITVFEGGISEDIRVRVRRYEGISVRGMRVY